MRISLGDYANLPNISRKKKTVVCKSFRIGVPVSLATIVDSIDCNEGGGVWCRIFILAKLHTSFGVRKEDASNCIMAFAMQYVLDDYSLNKLLRTKNPWGTTELKGKGTGCSVDVPNFIIDASECVLGSSWFSVYASDELDKAVSVLESKNIRVTKRRLSAFFVDKLILYLSPKKYQNLYLDV